MREEDLSPGVQAKIDHYCARVAGENAPHEVGDELRDHFQDRVLGYLNKHDALTEEDAFVLAREHFGNPAEVGAELTSAHAEAIYPALYRRMAAAAILCVVTQVLFSYASVIFTDSSKPSAPGWDYVFLFMESKVLTIVYVSLLWYWKRKGQRGESLWFMRWRPTTLVSLVLGVYAAAAAAQFYTGASFPTPDPANPWTALAQSLWPVLLTVQAFAWFWWCGIPPRSWRVFVHAAMGLGLYGWPLYAMVMATEKVNALAKAPQAAFQESMAALAYSVVGAFAALPMFFVQSLVFGILYLLARRVTALVWAPR